MTIRLNGSTSGYTEIDAPAVAGSNTLVLPTGNGSADQVLSTNGSGTLSFVDRGRMVLETAKAYNWNGLSTNTSLDFTGIPSWVKKITVMFQGVSTSGTSNYLLQIGDSGGIETSNYLGTVSNNAGTVSVFSSGYLLQPGSVVAAGIYHAQMTLCNIDGNTWSVSGAVGRSDATNMNTFQGSKTLSGTLDRVRITTVNGTDTFDAGSVNLLLEG